MLASILNANINKKYKYLITFLLIFISLNFSYSQNKIPKIGLVLSGGGAKGLTYIPILKEIESAGIKIDYIAGTSIGAIIGGLYASGYNANQIDSLVNIIDFEDILLKEKKRKHISFNDKEKNEKYIFEIPFSNFKPKIPSAISKGQGALTLLSKLLQHIPNNIKYENLPTPFLCIATNLETGDSVELTKGFLPKSILASSAYPLLINPVEIDSLLLSDGALVNNYPVLELKKRNIDIIIGVNISSKIKKKEELQSANQILGQISDYYSYKNMIEQEKLVDIKINPNISKISVTDFDKKDSIINIGKISAQKIRPKLDSIAKIQGLNYHKKPLNINHFNDSFKISKIIINGNKKYSYNFINQTLNIDYNKEYSYLEIEKSIDNLYATDFFKLIKFHIQKENDLNTLYLEITENKDDLKAKLSLNYNHIFKIGILINISKNNFIFKGSKLSYDFVFGDMFRYNLNYFIDKGLVPSLGLSHSLTNYPTSIAKGVFIKSKLINTNVFLRSTLYQKYATEIGIQHLYSFHDAEQNIIENNIYYFSPYFKIKIDNRDDNYFPTEGIKMVLASNYLIDSNQNNFNKYMSLNGSLEHNISFRKLTINSKISTSSALGLPNSPLLKSRLGGNFNQEILNFEKFHGYYFDEISGNYKFLLSLDFQYQFIKRHYFNFSTNTLNIEDNINQLKFFKFKYIGYSVGYSYNSSIGPLNFFYSYSPNNKNSYLNLNLGYTF